MSRRRRQGLSPTLFPFLAVLVCTLGMLILFLALVAQNATEAAEQESRAKRLHQAMRRAAKSKPDPSRPTAEEVKALISEEQFRTDQFLGIRDSLTADIEDRRDQVTYLEEQIEKVRTQLKRLNDQVESAMGMTTGKSIDQETIDKLQAQIAAKQKAVEELRRRASKETPRIVIVPHKGPNGTDRRAIYLECTSEGVNILPEGSKITIAQLEAAPSANPLDAALRVIRLHVMQHYGDSTPPYPLLVVRPDGIETYGAARKAMRDWDDQFGYELVPADIELAFSKPDVTLKQKVDLAIRSAAARQTQHQMLARNHRFGGSGGRLPTLSAASLDRAGRAGGYRSLRDDYGMNAARLRGLPASASDSYSAGTPGPHYRDGTLSAALHDDQHAAPSRPSAPTTRSSAGQVQAAARPGGGGSGADESLSRSQFSKGTKRRIQANSYTTPGGDGSSPGRAGGNTNEPQPLRDPVPAADSNQQDSTGKSRQPTRSQPSGQVASQLEGGSGGSSSAPAAATPSAMGQAPSAAMKQSMSPPQNINLNRAASQTVRRQGRNWALPSEMNGVRGNAIIRTIRMRCYPDRFELLAFTAGRKTELFSFADGDVDGASLQLATALRDRIDRWGAALPGGRWQPQLEVDVMPGGRDSFQQLEDLMRGSGIEVMERVSR